MAVKGSSLHNNIFGHSKYRTVDFVPVLQFLNLLRNPPRDSFLCLPLESEPWISQCVCEANLRSFSRIAYSSIILNALKLECFLL